MKRTSQIKHLTDVAGDRFIAQYGMTVQQYFDRYELAYSVDEITHRVDSDALYRHLCHDLGIPEGEKSET